MQTLDDLPILATAKTKRPTKAEREHAEEIARAHAINRTGHEWHFRQTLRVYSLLDVQRMWFEEQAKLKEAHHAEQTIP